MLVQILTDMIQQSSSVYTETLSVLNTRLFIESASELNHKSIEYSGIRSNSNSVRIKDKNGFWYSNSEHSSTWAASGR